MFKRFWWVFLVMVVGGIIFGLFVAAAITYVMPKKYESEAVVEIFGMSSHQLPTEIEKMKSRANLEKVVADLSLAEKWAEDQASAIRMVKEATTASAIRGTDLISVKARSGDKEDARNIAVAVVRAYRENRVAAKAGLADSSKAELETAINAQETKVEEHLGALEKLRGVPNLGEAVSEPDAGEVAAGDADVGVGREDYIEAKRGVAREQGILHALKLEWVEAGMIIEKSNDGGVLVHEDPHIPNVPISPSVGFNLATGAGLGFLLSPLISVGFIAFLNRMFPPKTISSPAVPVT